jgi:hypothetical protein
MLSIGSRILSVSLVLEPEFLQYVSSSDHDHRSGCRRRRSNDSGGFHPMVRTLQPYETLAGGADEILDFPNPLSSAALYVGSLTVTADGPGLIRDLLFGDARQRQVPDGLFAAAACRYEILLRALRGGSVWGSPRGLFTGLALYNSTRDQVAEILVEAYSPQNLPIGRAEFTLAAGRRLSRTLSELIPSITQQNGGTVRVTSTVPLLVFQVFGSSESLVAVPPLILP